MDVDEERRTTPIKYIGVGSRILARIYIPKAGSRAVYQVH